MMPQLDGFQVLETFQTKTILEQLEILQSQANQLKQSKENIIDIPGTIVEYRNIESGEHSKRVKQYTKILADQIMKQFPEYNLNEKQIRQRELHEIMQPDIRIWHIFLLILFA